MRSCLICLLWLLSLPAMAQIYKYTDADGNTAYSNEPPNGKASQAVELPPLNSIGSQQRAQPQARQPALEGSVPAAAYDVLQLSDLPTDEALRANNGTFTVSVQIQPRLEPQHRLQLLLDGQPYGQPSNVPRLQLVYIDRGEHSLAVQVLANGQAIQTSPTVTFTVQRVHQ